MIDELENIEIRISDEGHDQFGAKTGTRDDLVCALAWRVIVEINPGRVRLGFGDNLKKGGDKNARKILERV